MSPSSMRISLRKLSDERHELAVERAGGGVERAECETRSTLQHDLLHYAVEAEAGLEGGFWGTLAGGRTLASLNDRSRPFAEESAELQAIEQIVGALHGATKGSSAGELAAGMRRFAAALGATFPEWLTAELIARVLERMRRLQGRWRATPFGQALILEWPATDS